MYQRIKSITSLIRSKLSFTDHYTPSVGLVLGSGLGSLVDAIEGARAVEYADIEGFVTSTVTGHGGRFVAGTIDGVEVIVMQGRVHYYEGYEMEDVVLGVRAMCEMGIKTLIVTNAAGGVNETFAVGDLMMIDDQINLLPNPLIGRNIDQIGPRFPDMTEAFSARKKKIVIECAEQMDIKLRRGVYLASTGSTYETPAEYEFFHRIGADACGMSTTPEVIVARHAGVDVVGFSVITNVGRGVAATVRNSHAEVVEASERATKNLTQLIKQCLPKLN